jgi:hypothetical protein
MATLKLNEDDRGCYVEVLFRSKIDVPASWMPPSVGGVGHGENSEARE